MEGAKLAGNAVPKFGGAGVHEHKTKSFNDHFTHQESERT
jgi:hypothetical protein